MKTLLILFVLLIGAQLQAEVYICYCIDASHTSPVILAFSDSDGDVEDHGLHTNTGKLHKAALDYATLKTEHGEGLFQYLVDTYGPAGTNELL